MKIRRTRRVLVAAAAVAIMVPLSAASGASAVSPSAPKVWSGPASYVPLRNATSGRKGFDTVFNNMDYNGGPVMPSNTDYLVFWSPGGLGAYGPQYVSGLKQYFKDL